MGRIVHKNLSQEEKKAVVEAGYLVTGNTLPVFPRYMIDGVVYASFKPSNERNSSVCMVNVQNGTSSEFCFGTISKFCFVGGSSAVLVIESLFECTGESILVQSMHRSSLLPEDIRAARGIDLYIYKVKKSQGVIAISPKDIVRKCVHVPVKHSPTDFIVTQPNTIEHH